MLKETLKKIGLSKKEVDFYLLIMKHNEITASHISKISGESRTHIYDTIAKLSEKGLVSHVVKNNVKYFRATDSNKIIDYLEEKKSKINEEKRDVLQILPELKKIQKENPENIRIEVYEGKEGIKTVMNDLIREGKNFVTWGATNKVKEYLPDFFINKYLNERKKKNIKAKQLFTDIHGILKTPLSENRKLPKEFATPTTTAVYGDKVTIWLWLEIPRVILIENPELATSYKQHFGLMWESVKIMRGEK
ncbi:MAG: hypothetical protein KKF46_00090 [Nanoarchaeota archaeon]|nr:hypothetical protein [Nanoarchaeota archaeon]MBU1320733.1 hypothetical protein [Nanoarchaeota archaeon]MBU1596983.1 hypothetical protein [Nanoarchaeota archaeon]MBU2441964.1 hypothetical protein [Nanoarchaeota archaeon]